MVNSRDYKELTKYEPRQEGSIVLERVLHKGGDLFQLTREERVRIASDTYFWELVELVDGGKSVIFNDHPVMRESYRKAFRDFGGDILIGGLGIGLMFSFIESFTSLDIVERDKDIIKIVAPYFVNRENVRIVGMDILEFNPTREYDFIYEDFYWHERDEDERKAFDAKFSPHAKNIRHWEY